MKKSFTATTAITVVVANMVGTGVFTSLGYQLADIRSVFVILLLWFLGGLAALSGALCYAELGARMPRSGGEYNFLGRVYHPAIGFVSGWVSATVGFAAPTALAAMTFAAYLDAAVDDYISIHRTSAAVFLVLALTVVHAYNRNASGNFQNWLTAAKIALIFLFTLAVSLFASEPQPMNLIPEASDWPLITSGAFAVSLIYVNYAYTGWNAATYLTGEVEDAQKTLPRILILGTGIVMLLYLALNAVFLYAAPMEALANKIEIGVIVAEINFGPEGGLIMGLVLAAMLISTVSAMIMAGPRVLQMIGEDHSIFKPLAQTNAQGVPWVAIYFQSAVTIGFVLTSTFESVLLFSGFMLGMNSLATVIGLLWLRFKEGADYEGYKTFAYPLPPIIYILIMTWTLIYVGLNSPTEAAVAGVVIAAGLLVYYIKQNLLEKSL